MIVWDNLPVAIHWDAAKLSNHDFLNGIFAAWPAESTVPIILISRNAYDVTENFPHPQDYVIVNLTLPSQRLPNAKTIEPRRVYLVDDSLHLEYAMSSKSEWSVKDAQNCANFGSAKSYNCPAGLVDYAYFLEEKGTILNCASDSCFSTFSLGSTPVLEANRILALKDPCLFLSQQFGKARSLNEVVLGKANNLLESIAGIRMDWFHRGWQFEHLSHELSGSIDLLSYCDAYPKAQILLNRLLQSNLNNFLSLEQLQSIQNSISSKLRRSEQQVKIWLVGAGQLQLLQILFMLLSSKEDQSRLRKQLRIYITDSSEDQLASLKSQVTCPALANNILPESLMAYYRDLGVSDVNDLLGKTRSIRQLLAVHSKLNIFTDPLYRSVDVVVCGSLLGALNSNMRRQLLRKFSSSQPVNSLFVTAPKEAPEVIFSLLDSGFEDDSVKGLFHSNGVKEGANPHEPLVAEPNLYPENRDDATLGRTATFVIDDFGQVVNSKGNASAFVIADDGILSSLESKLLFEVLSPSLGKASNALFNNRNPLKACKKMVIGEFDVVVLSIYRATSLMAQHSDQVWNLVIESVEDIELDLSVEKIGELDSESAGTRALLTNLIADGQLMRQKSIRKLEDLNLELAEKNEQYSTDAAKYRLLNAEVSDSNLNLNKQLKAANSKMDMLTTLFEFSHFPAALISEHGSFETINDALADKLNLNRATVRIENLNIFRLESQLPNRTLVSEFGEVLKDRSKRRFVTALSGVSVEVLLSPIESALQGRFVLLEIVDIQTSDVEKTELNKLFNEINIATVEIDRFGMIESVDSMVQLWLGRQVLSPIGRSLTDVMAPDYHSLHEAKWEELQSSGFIDYEAALLSSDNRLIWCRVKAMRHPSKQGQSYLFLLENILEQQRTQQEILMSQKMESLGLLTGGIAHDFNNILAIILGYTDLLILNSSDAASSENAHLNHIRDAGKRAQHLIKQMLFYSRGDDHHDAQQHDVCKAVSGLLPLIRSSFPNDIQLSTEIDIENALVDIDPTHLDQILMNLCINARDAVEATSGREGEITISVDAGNKGEEIRQCASCRTSFSTLTASENGTGSNGYVVIRITDNGTGIESDVIKHVFDPFFSTKEVGKGSGMGLSVIHGLVHQYGGHIEVFSSNYGVQFCIWLPASNQSKVPGLSQQKGPAALNLSPWRVLLVEDDLVVAEVSEMILANLGMTVTVKKDGVAATEYLIGNAQDVDLIISDLSMPKMDGLGLARWCDEHQLKIPVLLLTGNEGVLNAKTLPVNVDSILNKPASMSAIKERLARIQAKATKVASASEPETEAELA